MRSVILFSLLCLAGTSIKAQDTSRVDTWFIGGHGYLIKGDSQTVAMDANIFWEGDNYGYIKPSRNIKANIETGEVPFEKIDLLLISHIHSDHFNSLMIEQSMNLNPEAVLVTLQAVADQIASEAEDYASFSDRVYIPDLEFYESKDTTIKGIELTLTNIEHGVELMELQTPSFVVDGIRFVQLNGWNPITGEMSDTLGFNRERADVAFLGYSYIMEPVKYEKFDNHIDPVFSTISHIDGASQARFEEIQNKIDELQGQHRMNLIYRPMEHLRYSKTNDTLIVDTINRAPEPWDIITTQEAAVNEEFRYTFIETLFADPEEDSIIYMAEPRQGGEFPEWLSFDPATLTFSGTPTSKGNIYVTLMASDTLDAFSYLNFRISVIDPNALDHASSNAFEVYPNPATDQIHIDLQTQNASFSMINIAGRVVKQGKVTQDGIFTGDLPAGTYTLYISTEKGNTSCMVVIR